ncbi:hypothetical protein [uncultured Senegalimassilia sp.]|uniref:hypothetical protein n=1 Tax=uncultured Senegalimassilia sp. TaxID=1714350 RepID=UPI002675BCEF|nr:hypothetical protein [uncultured Senegalimassilia sp.]
MHLDFRLHGGRIHESAPVRFPSFGRYDYRPYHSDSSELSRKQGCFQARLMTSNKSVDGKKKKQGIAVTPKLTPKLMQTKKQARSLAF